MSAMTKSAAYDPSAFEDEPWRRNLTGFDEKWLGPRGDWFFTGRSPNELNSSSSGGSAADSDAHVIRSMRMPNLSTLTRSCMRDYFDNGWTLTEVLFSSLQGEEAFYRPPVHGLRHPMVFYYVHVAVFYINKFRVAGLIQDPINPEYERLFEQGVDEMDWDDMNKNEIQWPSLEQCLDYRRKCYQVIVDVIETHPELGSVLISWNHPLWSLLMACEHERIHIETSSVLIRELPIHLVRKPEYWPEKFPIQETPSLNPVSGVDYPMNPFLEIPADHLEVLLGKRLDFPSFGWDCDYGESKVNLSQFAAEKFKVSNGEFWEFVREGGYQLEKYWTEEGWKWRRFRNTKWPTFWIPDGPAGLHHYKLRTVFEVIPMQWDWPAIVNVHEGRAFARWKAERDGVEIYRLETEAEHVSISGICNLRDASPQQDPPLVYGGASLSKDQKYNFQLAFSSESPVQAFDPNELGFHDTFGNVWEWTETIASGLPGYKSHPYYWDFSEPCFDGRHHIIKSGSFISTGNEAEIFARYHFRPHFFQHAGVRLVRPASSFDADVESNVYESQQMLNDYLSFHFCPHDRLYPYAPEYSLPDGVADFPVRCATEVLTRCADFDVPRLRALDLGCATGRSSFELSRDFAQVIGIDFSASFITACQQLAENGSLPYKIKLEGDLYENAVATLDSHVHPSRCTFEVGDACNLRSDLGSFDAVLMANLICRLPDPAICLHRASELVNPGGILVLTTPFSWMEEFTPKEKWIGGKYEDNKSVRSADALVDFLSTNFDLIEQKPFPMLIRETCRKFQFTFPTLSVFRRK